MHSYLTTLTAETEGLRRRQELIAETERARRVRAEHAGATSVRRSFGARLLRRPAAA